MIPDQPEYEFYSKKIEEIGRRFNSTLFSPHITFGSFPDLPVQQLSSIMNNILTGRETIEFEADFVRCSSSPYQNLVHQYKISKQYKELSERAEKKLSGFQAKEELHISLLYGNIDCKNIEELSGKIEKSLPKKVQISEYQIIELSGPVEEWKILHRQPL